MLCSFINRYKYFGETFSLHLQGMGKIFPLGFLFVLKTEAASSSESFVPIVIHGVT
jgi:hypothetical protein